MGPRAHASRAPDPADTAPMPCISLFVQLLLNYCSFGESWNIMYRVEIDTAPAYELVVSLEAYLNRQAYKTLELGTGWAARVRETLDPTFAKTLGGLREVPGKPVLDLLMWQCPTKDTTHAFLAWLDGLSAGDFYACVAPFVPTGAP